DPGRYVQVGLRGYWPGEREFAWQDERGITSLFMHDVLELGIGAAVERAADVAGEGPAFLSVDVDVLDPAVAPGTGTPEPGGLTAPHLAGDGGDEPIALQRQEPSRTSRPHGRRARDVAQERDLAE